MTVVQSRPGTVPLAHVHLRARYAVGAALRVLAVLVVLSYSAGLTAAGWTVGLLAAALLHGGHTMALVRRDTWPTPADRVTSGRASLVCGVAALAAQVVTGPAAGSRVALVVLAGSALLLDRVDGEVARRTGTVTDLGARHDMEVDAFLVLVLSIVVATDLGAWVLLIGAARYLLLAASWAWPWLRAPTPVRWWAKVVAAVQGVVLTAAASQLLPVPVDRTLVLVALVLLAESFLHQVRWLRRHAARGDRPEEPPPGRGSARAAGALSVAAVWAALALPADLATVGWSTLVRVPLEALVLAGVLATLPSRSVRGAAASLGTVLAAVVVLKGLDLGFRTFLNRPYDPLVDWQYLDSAVGVVDTSHGRVAAVSAAGAVVLLVAGLLVLLPLAVGRVALLVQRSRVRTLRLVAACLVVWVVCAATGLRLPNGEPVATSGTAAYAVGQVTRIPEALREQREFARRVDADPLAGRSAASLLHGLRGKDVLVVFVESYGRVALDDPALASGIAPVLDEGTRRLAEAGFASRSAFLRSPTFGAVSWLAHATLQSGLWVNDQHSHDVLMRSRRLTLSSLFGEAGWRTVSVVPANTRDWPEGRSFYDFDRLYDARNLGYRGPRFGYPTMPDQFTLHALQELELGPRPRRPVFAEVDLISSHAPWSRIPELVDPALLGDGSVFDGMPDRLSSKEETWRSVDRVRTAYVRSLAYSLRALLSFVEDHGTRRTVVLLLGDHQPATVVSGDDAGNDVPVSILACDPAVLRPATAWGWDAGLRPGTGAPVWGMEELRDRFVGAYTRGPVPEHTEPIGRATRHSKVTGCPRRS